MRRFGPWLALRAEVSPAHPALEVNGHSVSYAELEERAGARARELRALGLRPGQVVAAALEAGSAFVELLHAASLCGAALLPLNTRLAPRELSHQLRDSRARLLLHGTGALASSAEAAAREVAGVERIEIDPRAVRKRTRGRGTATRGTDPDPILAILYTSGTTGRPKGAALTHANFFWSAVASAFRLGALPGDRWLACLPLFHVGGLSIPLRCALYGATAVIHRRFDPEAVNRAIDDRGITLISAVAPMLERILDARGDRPAPAQLRCVLLGGGPAPAPLLERARELRFPVALTYGLTEATSQVATRAPDAPPGSGLPPLPGTELCIAADDGSPVPAGEPGEILVRGPTVMRGYLNRTRETREVLRGGWLHTGDLGALDPSGALAVLERRSDLIVSGGENVYPAEVEAVLLEHPAVSEALVAGVPDPTYGRRPAAWVVVRKGRAPAEDELRAFCRARLAGYKVPVAFRFVPALPRNAAGKRVRRSPVSPSPGRATR